MQHNIKEQKVKGKGLWVEMIRMPNQQTGTRSAIPPFMAASLVHKAIAPFSNTRRSGIYKAQFP
jgi:hypothetical protein